MKMQKVFGGRVFFTERNGQYSGRWFWVRDSYKAAKVLELMLPYLRIKHDEAEVAIEFQKSKLSHNTPRSFKLGLNQTEIDFREMCYQKLKALKRIHNGIQDKYIQQARQLADDNRVNSGNLIDTMTTPSQATPGSSSVEGVTTRE